MNQKISLRLYNKEKNSIHLGRKLLEFHSAPLPHAPINQNPTGAGTPGAAGRRRAPAGTPPASCQTLPEASCAVSVRRAFADTDGNS